jgi:hypothetical protein
MLTVFFLVVSAVCRGSPLDPVEYEARAIQYRDRINSIRYTAVTTIVRPATAEAGEIRVAARQEVWMDARRYRRDETPVRGWDPPGRSQLPPAELGKQGQVLRVTRQTECRGCRSDGALLRYTQPGTPVVFYKAANEAEFEADKFDPRGLGHGSRRGPAGSPLRGMLTASNVQYKTVEQVEYAGEKAVLVTGTYLQTGSEHRCWLVPDKGCSVIRLEWSGTLRANGERRLAVLIENQLAQDAVSGVWFPKRSRSRTYTLGVLDTDQETTVELAELNRPLDDSAFTLAGLKLEPGTPVSDNVSGEQLFWSGTDLSKQYKGPAPAEVQVLAKPASPPTTLPASLPPDPARTPASVYALAAGLAVVGCGLLLLALRSRR